MPGYSARKNAKINIITVIHVSCTRRVCTVEPTGEMVELSKTNRCLPFSRSVMKV